MENYTVIGKILKSHGLKGDLKILLFDEVFETALDETTALFIKEKQSFVPYMLEYVDFQDIKRIVIKFDEFDSIDDVNQFVSKEVYLPNDFLDQFEVETPFPYEGFELIDNNNDKVIGKINQILDLPNQYLAELNINEKEVLIPLREEVIIKVDETKQQVWVEIPEGLLELYLEE